jgi:hypothetical protein
VCGAVTRDSGRGPHNGVMPHTNAHRTAAHNSTGQDTKAHDITAHNSKGQRREVHGQTGGSPDWLAA